MYLARTDEGQESRYSYCISLTHAHSNISEKKKRRKEMRQNNELKMTLMGLVGAGKLYEHQKTTQYQEKKNEKKSNAYMCANMSSPPHRPACRLLISDTYPEPESTLSIQQSSSTALLVQARSCRSVPSLRSKPFATVAIHQGTADTT